MQGNRRPSVWEAKHQVVRPTCLRGPWGIGSHTKGHRNYLLTDKGRFSTGLLLVSRHLTSWRDSWCQPPFWSSQIFRNHPGYRCKCTRAWNCAAPVGWWWHRARLHLWELFLEQTRVEVLCDTAGASGGGGALTALPPLPSGMPVPAEDWPWFFDLVFDKF